MKSQIILKNGETFKAEVFERHVVGNFVRGEIEHGGLRIKVWTFSGATWFQQEEE